MKRSLNSEDTTSGPYLAAQSDEDENLHTKDELLEQITHQRDEIHEDDWGVIEEVAPSDETDEGIDMSGSTSILPVGLGCLPYDVSNPLFKSARTYVESLPNLDPDDEPASETKLRQFNLQRGHEDSTDKFTLDGIVANPLLFYLFMTSVDGSVGHMLVDEQDQIWIALRSRCISKPSTELAFFRLVNEVIDADRTIY